MHAKSLPTRTPLLIFLALAVLVLLTERLVTQLPQFAATPALPLGVTIDLVVGLPVLYYLFIVRPYGVSPFTLTAAVAAAVALATLVLPTAQQQYLTQVRQLWVLAEPLLALVLLYRLRSLRRAYQAARQEQADLALNLEAAFRAVFGRALRPLVAEIVMLRYALFFWRPRSAAGAGQHFTMHRESAFGAIMGTLLLVALVETLGVHFLVARWSSAAALVLLVLSVYSLLFVVGHWAAVVQQPTVLEETHLRIRVGLVWTLHLPLTAVRSAQLLRDPDTLPKQVLNLAKPLVTPPNILLTCTEPVLLSGPYGLQKKAASFAFYIDMPQQLLARLTWPQPALSVEKPTD